MSLLTALHTGRSGLRIASTGLSVTSHNVSNVGTDGYSRKTMRSATANPIRVGSVDYGQGASVTGVARSTDFLINERYIDAIGDDARSSTTYESLVGVEASFDETGSGGPANLLEGFYDALGSMTMDPGSLSRRQEALEAGSRLTDSINDTSRALNDTLDLIYEDLGGSLSQVQQRLDAVADLNELVLAAPSPIQGGDYADQRDQIIGELAEMTGVKVDYAPSGEVTLFLGGHAVVSGGEARTIDVSLDSAGDPKVTVSHDSGTLNVTDLLGGEYGGLLDAYNEAAGFLSDLDTFSQDLADNFNTQHQAGFDAAGAAGGDFFTYSAGAEARTLSVDATLLADPSLFAAAGAATAAAGDGDNLTLLLAIEDSSVFVGGTRTARQALGDIYADVGSSLSSLELQAERDELRMNDMRALHEAVSGVDLDEEAAELLEWQAAYEASARVISTTNQMLSELMEIVR